MFVCTAGQVSSFSISYNDAVGSATRIHSRFSCMKSTKSNADNPYLDHDYIIRDATAKGIFIYEINLKMCSNLKSQ